ncbi:MAG: NAD-dependent epimerase [Bacteroidetes bacterium]|nr:MAG: NAD-dependent epimerase [Bacteroidota bacterium]
MQKVLVTGNAGFIGHHLAMLLLGLNYKVIGLDIINDYYDVDLKKKRLEIQGINVEDIEYGKYLNGKVDFIQLKLEDADGILKLFKEQQFDYVVNLAAQAGVRYSIENPRIYMDSNVYGFFNILEACRAYPVKHLVYASSSSVYGLNEDLPFKTTSCTDHPMALYGATKKTNEIMAHSYSHLYGIPTTGLRFFTVYGPWGRPDMALFLFADAILKDRTIDIFGEGKMTRDFTYVGDIAKVISLVLEKAPKRNTDFDPKNPTPDKSSAPYGLYNIGNNSPIGLMDYIKALEVALGKESKKNYLGMQPGDVKSTSADIDSLSEFVGYRPQVSIQEGVNNFIDWFKEYYKIE